MFAARCFEGIITFISKNSFKTGYSSFLQTLSGSQCYGV